LLHPRNTPPARWWGSALQVEAAGGLEVLAGDPTEVVGEQGGDNPADVVAVAEGQGSDVDVLLDDRVA
jgi:hypothetical protein